MTDVMPRRLLVVGSGAREHALCWRLAREPGVARIIVAPGNALMHDVAEVHPEVAVDDPAGLLALARQSEVELVVVGPEAPLVAGLSDFLGDAGISTFGPSAAAARLEGSKAFCREVCESAGVAMAEGQAFEEVAPALDFARSLAGPLVVKADGLAAGKGVTVCANAAEAEEHIRAALADGRFGSAGRRVVIERRLEGREVSVIGLCDGETCVLLPAARDHKRLLEEDRGPNTVGMGAYSPVEDLSRAQLQEIACTVHVPVLAEMKRRGAPFRGALYAGLMLTADGPRVLEFNVRLGDPETQAILARLAVPLAPILAEAAAGELKAPAGTLLPARHEAAVAVSLAAAGYPEAPRAGDLIDGISAARGAGALVFGAGVRDDGRGGLLTGGGRVLSVVARGSSVEEASRMATAAAELVTFAGRQLRTDIGRPASISGGVS
ncbi:phosphoribosylamine--glycine ligase [soil metagenome]